MKHAKIVLFLLPWLLYAGGDADASASKGSMTEAAFILQNKEGQLKEHIQHLKDDLTQACLGDTTKKRTVKWHHCQFRKKVMTRSIQDLEALLRLLQQYKERVSQDEPVKEEALKPMVDVAFLVKEKIDLEASLLKEIFARDYEKRLRKQRYHPRRIRNTQQEERCKRLAQVNQKLSSFEEVPRLFHLERLGGYHSR